MKTRSLVASLLFLAMSLPALAVDKLRVRVSEFAPLYFQQEGQWVGLDVELANAIATEAGFELEFVNLPWSRALSNLQSGEVQLMMNLTRTPDRETYTHFVGPVRTSKRALVVRQENLSMKISNLDELADIARRSGVSFGIQQNAKYTDEFDARLVNDPAFAASFDAVARGSDLPRKTAHGHNLGVFEDVNYVIYQLKTNPDFRGLAIHPFLLDSSPDYFGLSKHVDAQTIARIEAAYRKLEANGGLAKIRARWGDVGDK